MSLTSELRDRASPVRQYVEFVGTLVADARHERLFGAEFHQHGYRAYPPTRWPTRSWPSSMAILQRYGDRQLPSTRYRDLVDLVAIVTTSSVAADAVSTGLASEAERRDLRLPAEFEVPDRQVWSPGLTGRP